MSDIHNFCEERGISKNIEIAFTAYVKAIYSDYLIVKPGDTLSRIILSLTREKVEDLWLKFILDLKDILPPSSP